MRKETGPRGQRAAGKWGIFTEVTNLKDDKLPGSLRYAVQLSEQKAPCRTIVFRVGSIIHLLSPLSINKDNTTLTGQTAPGGGICLADYTVQVKANNVPVRFLRFRLGDRYQNQGQVDGDGGDDAFGSQHTHHLVLDHCSLSWSTDEACSVYENDSTTLSWNLALTPPMLPTAPSWA